MNKIACCTLAAVLLHAACAQASPIEGSCYAPLRLTIAEQLGVAMLQNRTIVADQPVARDDEEDNIPAPRWRPLSRSEFVAAIWPHARRAAGIIGVPPHALVAQAALETGWGRHMARDRTAQSGFNLFGIKAGADWFGGRSRLSTHEVVNGVVSREDASFRGYDSVGEAFDDYVAFLRRNPRYAETLRRGGDSRTFAAGLQKAGYSTDPHYADKIHQIANSRVLQMALARSGTDDVRPMEIAMSEFPAARVVSYGPDERPNILEVQLNPFD